MADEMRIVKHDANAAEAQLQIQLTEDGYAIVAVLPLFSSDELFDVAVARAGYAERFIRASKTMGALRLVEAPETPPEEPPAEGGEPEGPEGPEPSAA